jgi:PEP-CTERM motif-containing protein
MRSMSKYSVGVAIAAASLLAPRAAAAATITIYTDLTTFSAAAGSTVTEDFADTTLIAGLTVDGNSGGGEPGISGGIYQDKANCGICYGASGFDDPKLIFSPAVLAVGGLWDLTPGGNGGGLTVHITFSDATTADTTIGGNYVGFFGITSNVAISSIGLAQVGLTGNGETFALDDLRISGQSSGGGGGEGGGGTQVPEPSTVILTSIGLLGLVTRSSVRRISRG